MYAIIETGGKQYKVSKDDVIRVEKLNINVGEVIDLKVLLTLNEGKIVENAEVKAEIVEHGKDKKLTIFRYNPKKRVRKKQGHRQPYTALKIVSVK